MNTIKGSINLKQFFMNDDKKKKNFELLIFKKIPN